MNNNSDSKDLTQYAIKCTSILGSILDSLVKYQSAIGEEQKEQCYEEIAYNITNFELTLDSCFVDVNESLAKIGKAKFDRRVINNNIARSETDTTRVSQNDTYSNINEEIMDDESLVDIIVNKISDVSNQLRV